MRPSVDDHLLPSIMGPQFAAVPRPLEECHLNLAGYRGTGFQPVGSMAFQAMMSALALMAMAMVGVWGLGSGFRAAGADFLSAQRTGEPE
jgi:hypothetical protein